MPAQVRKQVCIARMSRSRFQGRACGPDDIRPRPLPIATRTKTKSYNEKYVPLRDRHPAKWPWSRPLAIWPSLRMAAFRPRCRAHDRHSRCLCRPEHNSDRSRWPFRNMGYSLLSRPLLISTDDSGHSYKVDMPGHSQSHVCCCPASARSLEQRRPLQKLNPARQICRQTCHRIAQSTAVYRRLSE